MRLSDMRPGRDDAPLPPEVEAELEALDAALRGEDVPPGMEGLNALVGDLRDERAEPDPEFGASLDRWAAAGFPRGRRPGLSERATRSDAGGRARLFAQSLTMRKLAYAGGAAATLVALVLGVSQIDFQSTGDQDDSADSGASIEAVTQEDAGGGTDESAASGPFTDKAAPQTAPALDAGRAAARGFGRDGAGDVLAAPRIAENSGPARGQDVRKVERDAQLTLAASPDEVQDVTNDAIDVVESHKGIVESSTSSVTDDRAQATLRLIVPTRRLDATLEQLSDLADVKSMSEGAQDITRPFVDAHDRLAGFRAERRSLLAQIEAADTQEELDQLKLRLQGVNNAIAQAEAEFENVKRRANLSNVTLEITSNGADSSDDWSFDDALDDAGNVLTVAAGVILISAAVLLPLALIAAIAYFVLSASRRHARERALDE
jgi:hypothetical protein